MTKGPKRWLGLAGLTVGFVALPVVQPHGPASRMLVDRDGQLLAAHVAADEQWRLPPTRALPPRYVEALLAFEDRRFYQHPGVDPIAVGRAALSNLRRGRVVSGASTISMQVVRLGRNAPPRTLAQKLWEALLAVRLEIARSKAEILSIYAHNAPFGGNVVGIETAAWRYFGRSSQALTWAEAALLAVLPNSPSLMHPGRGRSRLRAKRDRLLVRLHEQGRLSNVDLKLAVAEPLPTKPKAMPQHAVHWLAYQRPGVSAWSPTTLDRALQARTERRVRTHLATLAGDGIHNAAVVVVHVPTGETLAYVGNGAGLSAAEHAPYVDVARAGRSTGSILKPLLYAQALDAGELNPAERLVDAPVRVGTFFPENYDGTFQGVVRADAALAQSLNVPAVLLLRRVGVSRFLSFLRTAGISSVDRTARNYGLSLVLGGAEARLWDLVNVYAALAWRATGHQDAWPGPKTGLWTPTPVQPDVSVGAAYLTLSALKEVQRPGHRRHWRRWAGEQSVYWKTGTSFGFRDAWAIGVTESYAVGVWVGNADGEGRPGLVGLRAAAPLMFSVFDLLPKSAPLEMPTWALKAIEVCPHSGRRPGPNCGARETVNIPSHSDYTGVCPYCQTITCDAQCAHRVNADCHPLADIRIDHRFVLPARIERYYRRVDPSYRSVPPMKEGCSDGGTSVRGMSCVFPPEEGQFYIPKELNGERGQLVFEAAHRDRHATIHWHLDDTFMASTRDIHQVEAAPVPGDHVLTLIDHRGERIQRRFRVMAGAANDD